MNIAVNSAALLAVPSIATADTAIMDIPGQLARLEQAIDLLRTRYVCDGWKMDEAGAERAVRYFRAGCPDDDEEWGATLFFIVHHGLSFNWIVMGDVGSMICMEASRSPAALSMTSSEDPIFVAIEAHRNAEAAYDAHCRQNDRLEAEICSEKRQTKGAEIVETDDPRWIAFEQELDRLGDIELEAEAELANVVPTTPAGVVALLQYAADHEKRGCQWRDLYNENDQPQCTWYEAVLQNIVEGLKA